MRRDIGPHTPAFTLTAEQIAICHTQAALGWLDATPRSRNYIGSTRTTTAPSSASSAAWTAANAPVWREAA